MLFYTCSGSRGANESFPATAFLTSPPSEASAIQQDATIEALRLQRIKRRWNVPYTSSPEAVEA